MIRRSTLIAAAAIFLSLMMHFFGLSFTARIQPNKSPEETATDVVAMGNAFEDVAETVAEPVEPEPAPAPEPELPEPAPEPELPEPAPEPEPPEEEVPEPETAEAPTTEVLVASSNPQDTPSPDTGSAHAVRPDAAGPADFDNGTAPEPKTVEPAGGEDAVVSDAAETPPVELETVEEIPKGTPDAPAEPVEPIAPAPTPAPGTTPTSDQLAALPPPVAPSAPVAPVPEPSAVPVIPLAPEAVESETPEAPVEPEISEPTIEQENSQSAEAQENSEGSDQAVASSLRPQLPTRRPPAEPEGQRDGTTVTGARIPRSQLIESPLTAYRRNGTDLSIQQDGGSQSGGLGFQNSRGPGNSDVTNYAGRVFVHLNRAPAVRVVGRGYVRVFFEINPDGSVARIDIIESSGSVDIERAAKAQIRAAEPLPRPPNGNVRRMSLYYRPN